MILSLLENLNIQEFASIDANKQVTLFGLWKFEKDNDRYAIYEKDCHGVWQKKSFTDCSALLCLNEGIIEMPSINSFSIDEMDKFELKINGWLVSFIDAAATKIKLLFRDKYKRKTTKQIDSMIYEFVDKICRQSKFESYSLKICHIHNFFNEHFNAGKKLLMTLDERILIKNLVNISAHPKLLYLFHKQLPNHLALLRVIECERLVAALPQQSENMSAVQLISHIMNAIDDVVTYTNATYEFIKNMDSKSLCTISKDKEKFVMWVKFFEDVSGTCHCFDDVHELYSCFMRIGIRNCVKNQNYVEKIFQYFQRKQFQHNSYDLEYALSYSLIENSFNWDKVEKGKVDQFIYNFEDNIIEVRRQEIVNSFMELSSSGLIRFSICNINCEKTKRLWDNCLILCGLACNEDECKSLSFIVYKNANYSLLLGGCIGISDGVSLYMESLIGDGDCFTLRQNCERYFHKVMGA